MLQTFARGLWSRSKIIAQRVMHVLQSCPSWIAVEILSARNGKMKSLRKSFSAQTESRNAETGSGKRFGSVHRVLRRLWKAELECRTRLDV